MVFQTGQKNLTGWPTSGLLYIDNGGPVHTVLPVASGTFTLVAGSATVANTAVTAGSQIFITLKTAGGTLGSFPYLPTITPGTGFTVAATGTDTSVYNYSIVG